MSTVAPALEFITRTGCTLCDEAEPEVRRLAGMVGMEMIVRDVDSEPGLAEFGERVPVVLSPTGQVLAEGRISSLRLAATLVIRRSLGF